MNKWSRRFESNHASAKPAVRRRAPTAAHYFAFLSYSHSDSKDADWLHEELERFRVPSTLRGRVTANGVVPKRLTPIFRDQHDLAAADDLNEEICDALEASRCLLVLCSPAAARSKWINVEIETFRRIHPEGCIIAAVIAGEPLASDIPGREAEECFPPALVAKYNRRGRPTGKKTEPLAADLREGKGGRRIGFLKIVAGMLGVGLDELVQRETTRRHRQLAYVAAASLGGMAVTSTLAFTAIEARNSAREQRREAEGLVAFMVGDLKDKLEPIGRLDALDGVGSRVLAYYRKQDTAELSDAALVQRSSALSLTAQVAYLRGHYDSATQLYRQAMAGTAEAVRRNPDDPQRLYDHAQNVFYIGDIARLRGDIGTAETYYRGYKRLADRMVAIDPNNLKWRMEVAYANEDLGILLKNKRRFAEAGQLIGRSVGSMQSLSAVDPANAEYQQELGNVLGWFAEVEGDLGQFDSAIAARQRQIAFLEQHVSGSQTDVSLLQRLVPAHEGLGVLLTDRGKLDQAMIEYRRALAQANSLLAIEPTNSLWRDWSANTHLALARNLLATGHAAQASEEASAGCAIAGALRAQGPKVVRWRSLQTTCLSMRSRLALASGGTQQALTFAEQALASAQAERSGDPVSDRFSIAASGRMLGDVRQRLGDSAGANDAWSAALNQLPANVAEVPFETNERVELLRRLGRSGEAQDAAARLKAMGYRSVP
jgi:tetratricopeptide (TPR) repeat protein